MPKKDQKPKKKLYKEYHQEACSLVGVFLDRDHTKQALINLIADIKKARREQRARAED